MSNLNKKCEGKYNESKYSESKYSEGKNSDDNNTKILLNGRYKLNKCISKFHKLGIINNSFKLSYSNYLKEINSKGTISIFKKILSIILDKDISDELSKTVISIYIFKNFKKETLNMNNALEIRFYALIVLIIGELNSIYTNFIKLIYYRSNLDKLIKRYLDLYLNYYKEKKFLLLNLCIKKFKKYENTFYYVKSLSKNSVNLHVAKNLRKLMNESMKESLQEFSLIKEIIQDFTVVNKNNIDYNLIKNFRMDFFSILKLNIRLSKYELLEIVFKEIKTLLLILLKQTDKILFIKIFDYISLINKLKENKLTNNDFILFSKKIINFLKPIVMEFVIYIDHYEIQCKYNNDINENIVFFVKYLYDEILEKTNK